MKILVVIHSLQGGGAERVAALLAGSWAQAGNRVSIATLTASAAIAAYDVDPKVECVALRVARQSNGAFNFLLNTIKTIYSIRRLVRRTSPDLVVSFIDATNIIVALSCVGLRVRTIACERVHPPMHQLTRVKEVAR